jgi:hypothetical protein
MRQQNGLTSVSPSKRMQKPSQTAFETVVQTEERDSVQDCLHTVSRKVVKWVSQLTDPLIVFE